MTIENAINKLIDYYQNHQDDFNNDLEELDNWNGALGDDRRWPMEELDDQFYGKKPSELLGMVSSDFNITDNYFYGNSYGELCSENERDYSDYLDADYIQDIIDNEHHLYLSDGARKIIDDMENDDEDEDENENSDSEI